MITFIFKILDFLLASYFLFNNSQCKEPGKVGRERGHVQSWNCVMYKKELVCQSCLMSVFFCLPLSLHVLYWPSISDLSLDSLSFILSIKLPLISTFHHCRRTREGAVTWWEQHTVSICSREKGSGEEDRGTQGYIWMCSYKWNAGRTMGIKKK